MKTLFKSRLNSFHFALNGLYATLRTQSNIWVQIPIGILVVLVAFYFGINRIDWLILVLTIAGVLTAELINTSIEVTLNYLAKEHHLDVKAAKDIAAGAVLVTCIASVIIGLIIFLPYIFS